MKKMAAALMGVFALFAAAGLLLSDHFRKGPTGTDSPASESSGTGPASGKLENTKLADITREESPITTMEMVSLYSLWSKTPARAGDRRGIVDEIVRRVEPGEAITLLSMAVAGDPTPLESDAMIKEVAHAMAPLWKDDATFAQGRDMLRLTETDKTRALFAASLTERAKRPPSGLPEITGQEQHELASDLIQINMNTQNRTLKEQTLAHVHSIAGPEVSEVLADPANAHNSVAMRRLERGSHEVGEQARAGHTP